ncbi:Glycerol-3-phosphate acyltransferase 1 [Hibiscus syriacus]|uniref:Glycerol-3-phosphate acyltransferase 1 n=1 Tax=Hibiscus syriacus TaxID=106335 RepID=A0A6A3A9L7_HIBSY|nr:Glycerol-3-phosphate acyltransferase 1 [Hibiscus syriacus]
MLVAFEGGSIFRAFLLLLSCSFLWVLDYELKIRVMIFISFCGLRKKDIEIAAMAVLPKFYLENLNLQAYEIWSKTSSRVVFTSIPRVMVEGFLKEYMSVDDVIGTELHRREPLHRLDVGLVSSSHHDHRFISLCKEAYVVDGRNDQSCVMPRDKYPKPLIFHDGRLAFLPTPSATLYMFLWLPFGIILAIFRILVGICLPYRLAIFFGSLSGVQLRFQGFLTQPNSQHKKGVLYVCTHRTLLDPVFLSTALCKPLTAVTYSLSKMSEIIAPIRTVRLTRDRNQDGKTMQKLLSEGDLVVCPEGTTCREPYLLRFSSLFAELADDIVPVAMNAHVPPEFTCAGGRSSFEVANYIQRKLADALGFKCTTLTRRDKYLMLAGNEGIVHDNKRN